MHKIIAQGRFPLVEDKGPPQGVSLYSCAGPVHVEWDTEAVLTPLGQLPFFIDFLKAAGLFDAFVADCPLRYTSPNAPKKRDVLGTTMLSMLSGHKRYAHIAGLRWADRDLGMEDYRRHGIMAALDAVSATVPERQVRGGLLPRRHAACHRRSGDGARRG